MSYADFLGKAVSEKEILLEIAIGQLREHWVNYEAGIWSWTVTNAIEDTTANFQQGAFCFGSFQGEDTGRIGGNAVVYTIGSVTADGTVYSETESLANCRAQAESFYFDTETSVLYVHFAAGRAPWGYDAVSMGLNAGFATRSGYRDDVFYDGRIETMPRLSSRRDWMKYGVMALGGGAIKLSNTDGYFDGFASQDVYGQDVEIKLGGDDLQPSAYTTIQKMYVDDFTISPDQLRLNVADPRKKLQAQLPRTYFTRGDYSDLSDAYEGRPIPIIYGMVFDVPLTPITDAVSASSYTFKLADTSAHDLISQRIPILLDGVYRAYKTVTSAGTITVDSADYSPGTRVVAGHAMGYIHDDFIGLDSGDRWFITSFTNPSQSLVVDQFAVDAADINGTYDLDYDERPLGLPAARFTTSTYLAAFDTLTYATADSWTVSFRAKAADASHQHCIIGDNGETYTGVWIYDSGSAWSLRWRSNSGAWADGPEIDNINAWHHYAVTYSAGDVVLYVDGSGTADTVSGGSVIDRIGGEVYLGGDHNLDGWLDDIRIYDTALSGSAVSAIAGMGDYGDMLLSNGLDIAKDIISLYAGQAYTSDNYDLTAWASAASIAENLGLYIATARPMMNILEDIAVSERGVFMAGADGKYTFKYDDTTGAAVDSITDEEILEDPRAVFNSQEFLSSVKIGYAKSHAGRSSKYAVNREKESEVVTRYKQYRERTIETALMFPAQATAYASGVILDAVEIKPVFDITTKSQHAGIELMDLVNAEVNRVHDTWYGNIKCQVVGVDKSLDDYTVKYKLRYVGDA